MKEVKMSWKNLFTLFIILMVFALLNACSPGASQVSDSPEPSHVVTRVPTRARKPVSILNAYYSAIRMRETDAAVLYLANDIVMVREKPAPCLFEVVKGQ